MNTPKKKTSHRKSKSRSANWSAKAKAMKEAALSLGKSLVNKPSSFLKSKKDQVGAKLKKGKKLSPTETSDTLKNGGTN